jgi:hypothetical protein
MYEMMELLKAKYTTLATEKAAQSQELVKAGMVGTVEVI